MQRKSSIRIKILRVVFLSIFLITACLGYLSLYFSKNRLITMIGESSKGVAATVANFIVGWDLVVINDNIDDIKKLYLAETSLVFSHVYEKTRDSKKIKNESLDAALKKYVKYTNLLSNVAQMNKIEGPINVYVMDKDRMKLILSSSSSMLAGTHYSMRREAKNAISTNSAQASALYKDKDGVWISAYAPISFPTTSNVQALIEINNKVDRYIDMLNKELTTIILVCIAGLLITTVLSLKLVDRLVSAIKRLNVLAGDLRRENYDIKIEVRSGDEIEHLAETFDKLRLSIKDKIDELKASLAKEKKAHLDSIVALSNAIELRDPYTRKHLYRVEKYALLIAKSMRLSRKKRETLVYACYLHDIGKIFIEDALLKKPSLSPAEAEEIQRHAENGAKIISGIPFLEGVKDTVLYHQERFDGKGYPKGLKGKEIPLLARIVSVADAFDAMTTDRPYKPKIGFMAAMDNIEKGALTQFDPEICKSFLKYRNSIEKIASRHF